MNINYFEVILVVLVTQFCYWLGWWAGRQDHDPAPDPFGWLPTATRHLLRAEIALADHRRRRALISRLWPVIDLRPDVLAEAEELPLQGGDHRGRVWDLSPQSDPS